MADVFTSNVRPDRRSGAQTARATCASYVIVLVVPETMYVDQYMTILIWSPQDKTPIALVLALTNM